MLPLLVRYLYINESNCTLQYHPAMRERREDQPANQMKMGISVLDMAVDHY